MPIVVIGVFMILALYEFIPLIKQKLYKEVMVNGVIFIFAFVTFLLISVDVDIPSPSTPIRNFVTSIFGK